MVLPIAANESLSILNEFIADASFSIPLATVSYCFSEILANLGTAEDITLSASPTAFTEISFALTTPAPLGALESPTALFFFLVSPNVYSNNKRIPINRRKQIETIY